MITHDLLLYSRMMPIFLIRIPPPVFLIPRSCATVARGCILVRKDNYHGVMEVPGVYNTLLSIMFKMGLVSVVASRTDRALVVDGASGLQDLLEVRYGMYNAIASDHVYTVRLLLCDSEWMERLIDVILKTLQGVCKEFNVATQDVLGGSVSFGLTACHLVDRTSVSVLWEEHVVISRVVMQYILSGSREIVLPQLDTSVTNDNIVSVYNIPYYLYSILSTLVNRDPHTWDKVWPGAVVDEITVCRVLVSGVDEDDGVVSATEKVLQDLLAEKKGTSPRKLRQRIMPLYTEIAATVSV